MADLFDTQERTEEATPKRREDARERGQFARSTDLSTAVLLLATVAVLFGFGPTLLRQMGRGIVGGVQRLAVPLAGPRGAAEVLRELLVDAARMMGPCLLVAAAAGIALHTLQAGGLFIARDALAFKPERLDPSANLARLLGVRSLAKVGGALLKLALIVGVIFFALRDRLPDVRALADMPLEAAAPRLGGLLLALLLRVTGALVVLGCADWIYQRWQHSRDLRMSKQQVRDEHKQEDGDPQVKRRMRERLRQLAEKPLRQTVAEATVVVTNPTHFAVALEYLEGRSAAPKLVAKGVDRVAEEIRRLAREANVPVIEQPPLARALFRDVKVGDAIPERLYRAVAAVLAIVWRLRDEKARATRRTGLASRDAAAGRS